MAKVDGGALANQALLLGLISDVQLKECMNSVRHVGDSDAVLQMLERRGYMSPFQTAKLRKGDRHGFFLGGYRLRYMIGAGTFGRVFRADNPKTNEVVAVKVLRGRWNEDKDKVELFQREGKVGLSLQHPNIVRILAVDQDRDSKQHFLVTEFVEGSSLRDLLGIRGKLSVTEGVRILEDAAAGLAYAHSKGVTHRDIKATNILVSSQGQAKLVDFGLACVQQVKGKELEREVKVDRTVDYAGLEKATGAKPGDPRSDIYFLGTVFHRMLTGRSPLDSTKDRRLQVQRFAGVEPLGPADVEAPQALYDLAETMMALDPIQRYQSPAQLLEAVKAVRALMEVNPEEAEEKVVRTILIIEGNQKLQDLLRAKFRDAGFKVLLSLDPNRALTFLDKRAFDVLIMDAGSTGEEGLGIFRTVIDKVMGDEKPPAAILLLSENQADWAKNIPERPKVTVMVRPTTLNQLFHQVQEMLKKPASE